MFINFLKKLYFNLGGATTRTYWVVASFILAILGQSLIRETRSFPFFKPLTGMLTSWDDKFHLFFKNPVNLILGLFLITLSALVYSRLSPSRDTLLKMQEPVLSDGNWSPRGWKSFLPWAIVNLGIYILVMAQLARHQYSNLLLGGWLATILIFTILFWKNEQKLQANPDSSLTHVDGIWIFALFAFAIASATYLLNDLPAGWITDEGPFWKMARRIALGEQKPPFFDAGVFTFPIASSILQGWIMRWAGVNLWGWRFASALPAAATIIPLYLLARELFDRRAAVSAGVMMIANPYFLTFARLGYNNSQALFPVTLCIYFLVLGMRKNSLLFLWLAGLTAGLGFYTYYAAWLGLVVIFIIVSLPLLRGKEFQKNIISLTIVIAGALTVMLPRILYGISSDKPILLSYKIWETGPINTFYGQLVFGEERIAQAHIFTLNDQVGIFYDLPLYGILLVRGIVRTAAALFDPIGYIDHQITFGLSGPVSSIFFILGLGLVIANSRRLPYRVLSVWFLAGFFFLGAMASIPPRPTHLVAIIPVLSLISAVGLVSFLDALKKINPSNPEKTGSRKTIAMTSILLIIATVGLFQFFFLTPYIYFPPNTDDYISWLGRQIPASTNFLLVDHTSTTRNPTEESLLDFAQHPATTLTRADLEADPRQVGTWKNFAAFVDLGNGKELADWIAGKIPDSKVQTVSAPGHHLRGYVITDTQMNASMDISISHGLQDLWKSPVRNILIFCGAGILAFFLPLLLRASNKMNEMK